MDLSKLPKPLLYASIAIFLLAVGYGASSHVPGLNNLEQQSPENQTAKSTDSKTVKISVLEEKSQQPVAGAQVIIESEGGTDSDVTDSLGSFRVQIPATQSIRLRVVKEGYIPFDQNLNLLSNPDKPKRIVLKRLNSER